MLSVEHFQLENRVRTLKENTIIFFKTFSSMNVCLCGIMSLSLSYISHTRVARSHYSSDLATVQMFNKEIVLITLVVSLAALVQSNIVPKHEDYDHEEFNHLPLPEKRSFASFKFRPMGNI